jgi:hypothetical protein
MTTSPRLVVRRHAPWRRSLLIGGAVVLALAGAWFAFEWGRSRAGFDGTAAREQRAELAGKVDSLQRELRAMRLKVAMYETERAGQSRERAELARSIGELQAEVAKLTSELGFYRGVVGGRGPGEVVRIQQLRISRGARPGSYLLRLVLGRPLQPEDSILGKVRITFEGTRAGAEATLDLAAAAGVPDGELAFNFRYVQELEQAIRLPDGFTPARTTVELVPARKGVNPVRETFLWRVED